MVKHKFFDKIYLAISYLVIILIVFFISNIASAVDTTKTFRVGVYDNNPKVYLNDKGVASGLFPDILNYIAKQENWKLEYVFGTWEEGLERLQNGDIDVMVDTAITPQRQEKYDFTNVTVFNSWGVVYVNKNFEANSFKDLDGKKIAVLKSSVYYGGPEGIDTYMESFGLKADFVEVANQTDIFDLLNEGKVDAGVVSRVFALTNAKNYPNIKNTEIFFSPTELRFALTKNSPNNQYLISKLDYWVDKLKSGYNNIYQEILQQNNLSEKVITKEVYNKWTYISLICLGVIILIWVIISLLKRAGIITDKKLRESQELYKALVDAAGLAGLGIVILQNVKTKKASIISLNQRACEISGYSQEEAHKMTLEDVISPENINSIMKNYELRQSGKTVPSIYETEIICKNEKRIPIMISIAIMELNNKPATFVYFREITDFKRTEMALKTSERQLKDVIDFLPDATFVINKEKKIIVWNKAIERMTGVSAQKMIGRGNFEYTIPFYGERRPSLTDIVLSGDKTTIKKYVHMEATGESVSAEAFCNALYGGKGAYVFAKVSTIHDQNGHVVGAIESIRDITEQKNTSEKLNQQIEKMQEAEQALYNLTYELDTAKKLAEKYLHIAGVIIVALDKNGKITMINKKGCDILGRSEKDLIGRDMFKISLAKKDFNVISKTFKDVINGKIKIKEYSENKILDKNGIKRDIAWHNSLLYDEKQKIIGLLSSGEDITERLAATEALQEEKDKMDTILYSIGDGVFVVDKALKIIAFNKVAENISGYPNKEIIGKKYFDYLKFVNEKDDKTHNEFIKDVISSGSVKEMCNHTILIRKDKTKVPVSNCSVPLKDKDGNVIGCIVVFRDVTRERGIQQMKDEFLNIAAHDLRTPITALRGYSYMILKNYFGAVPQKLQDPVREIANSSERMARMVNDFLTVSRIEQGKAMVKPRKIDLATILDNVSKQIKQMLTKKKLNFRTNYPKIIMVNADPDKIQQVIVNLLDNAIKYTEKGTIDLIAKKGTHLVTVSVTDTGQGIEKENMNDLFNKFFQAKGLKKVAEGQGTGLGLGLYISRLIIEESGGKIWAESKIGKGSTFSFSLPVTRRKE